MGKGRKRGRTKAFERFTKVLMRKLDQYLRYHSLINAGSKLSSKAKIQLFADHAKLVITGDPIEWLVNVHNAGTVRQLSDMNEIYHESNQALTAEKMRLGEQYKAELRAKATDSELIFKNLLWKVKSLYVPKLSFTFQKGWYAGDGFYISDFYFPQTYSTVEIDGGYHSSEEQKIRDKRKEDYLRKRGIKTFRLTNDQVNSMTPESLANYLLANKIITLTRTAHDKLNRKKWGL